MGSGGGCEVVYVFSRTYMYRVVLISKYRPRNLTNRGDLEDGE